jgi:hypothetical protein
MSDCATRKIRFETSTTLTLEAAFYSGHPRREALAQTLLEQAERRSEGKAEEEKVRLVSGASYQGLSWQRARRVIYKAEVLDKGTDTRFVVTSRSDALERLYNWYVRRGEAEGWIEDFEVALKADQQSCQHFVANQFRLLCGTPVPAGC